MPWPAQSSPSQTAFDKTAVHGAMLLSLRVITDTKLTTVTVMMLLPGDCGTASALAAAMDVLMPEASRHARDEEGCSY
jgi:hypothetical protein